MTPKKTPSEADLRERSKRHLGIVGEQAPPEPPLREVVKASASGWYPLIALSLLGLIDAIDLQAFTIFGPEIKRAFSLTNAEVGLIGSLQALALVFGALPLASLAAKKNRARIIQVSAVAWAILQFAAGMVRGKFELGVVRTLRGLSDSSRQSVFLPLLTDAYPPEGRNRIFGSYFALATLGTVIGPGVIGFLGGVADLSFRVVFPLTGAATLLAVLFALRLSDPGFGRYDTREIREDVSPQRTHSDREEEEISLRFGEAFQRLLAIGTLYRILIGLAVVGVGIYGAGAFITLFIERQYGLDPLGRGLVGSVFGAAAALGYAIGGKFGERLFRRSPELVLRMLGLALGAYGVMLVIAVFQPNIYLFSLAHSAATVAVAAVVPATFNVVSAIVPPRLRSYSFAVQGIYIGFFGGLVGSVLIGSLADRVGYKAALTGVIVPSVIGGWIMAHAGKTFDRDLNVLTDEIIEDERVQALRESRKQLPICEVRGCDFSYGQVQVLFDVDFTVDEGGIVALLGTNGAGKSTLLRVISGLGIPQRGTVRFLGQNVTFLGTERRVRMGIVHILSGRPVFPTMTVIENLRAAGYSYRDNSESMEPAIAGAFELFPVLEERRFQLAGTLSGGEQQMLALARAVILEPKLLCIDELSLGLAPVAVQRLLDAVRRIRDRGTTVILVEQSVNLALSIADRAFFMEKGEIKFSGRAADLLKRDDLLRSVFLRGAAQGLLTARRTKS